MNPVFCVMGDVRRRSELARLALVLASLTMTLPTFGEAPFSGMRATWDRAPSADERATLEKAGAPFVIAEENSRLVSESLFRCQRYVEGWLAQADPTTGLIPENLTKGRDHWNGRNCGADNYPFMVLTCALCDRSLFEGRMHEMLRTEAKLTQRVDRLGDVYQYSKHGFEFDQVDIDRLMFDNAEYVKDGLIPLTEWLGPSAWSDRMIGIIDDIWKNAPVETPYGKIPTLNFEVNGDLLQANCRLYWFTGDRKYLDWAIRLGDYYLLGNHHPTRDLAELRLQDHGGEMVNGLTELYVAVSRIEPAEKRQYERPLREIFENILAKGRNADGMLYSAYNPKSGTNSGKLCDTWGYIYDGFYTMSLVDDLPQYREAASHALNNLLGKYEGVPWADKSTMDATADSTESAINLVNRLPVNSAATWCDRQMRLMWSVQRPDGVIEGWHGDGNFARTSIMYALWKSLGIHVTPWRADVRVGAARNGESICVFLEADKHWQGHVVFDRSRHKDYLHLPIDYPRINQFPEWFTPKPQSQYTIKNTDSEQQATHSGSQLISGVPLTLRPGEMILWQIRETPSGSVP